MSEEINNQNQTSPVLTSGNGIEVDKTAVQKEKKIQPSKKGKGGFWIVLLGLLIFLVAVGVSGYGGYRQGIEDRTGTQIALRSEDIEHQYQLGLAEFSSGYYERARQRFEFVLGQDPNHGRAIEMLARTLSVLNATATPTPVSPTATPTLTATPDFRSVDEKLTQAKEAMAAAEWDHAISTLLSLRKEDAGYHAVEVDQMMYVALRNRGADKILIYGDLEGGLYDLSQAELFGPLDTEAQGYMNWARFYILGASFWEVDWGQASYYFGQVAPYLPNLQDGNNWTATQRYREALIGYIDTLSKQDQWCQARQQMKLLQDFTGDPLYDPTAQVLKNFCDKGAPKPTKTPQP